MINSDKVSCHGKLEGKPAGKADMPCPIRGLCARFMHYNKSAVMITAPYNRQYKLCNKFKIILLVENDSK